MTKPRKVITKFPVPSKIKLRRCNSEESKDSLKSTVIEQFTSQEIDEMESKINMHHDDEFQEIFDDLSNN